MMKKSNILIALPARNEQERIASTILGVSMYGDVYVFDNNSHDDTSVISLSSGATVVSSDIDGYEDVVFHICNYFLESEYDVLVIMDGDGEVGVAELPAGLLTLGNLDGVIGERDVKKRLVERIIARLFFSRTGIRDIYCGFKILKKTGIAANFQSNTFATSIVNKRGAFTNINVAVKARVGSRLGSEIFVQIKIFWCGLLGLIAR
jgi:hypothetical protein